jgi:predicted phosphodiesterase
LASAQQGTVSLRPKLVVTYHTTGEPTPTPTPRATPTAAVNHPPQAGTVTPGDGSCAAGQTQVFTTTWSDPDGWQDLKQCYFHIGAAPNLENNVTLLYNVQKNKLWIASDDATQWLGGFAPGTASTLENDQAQVHCDQTVAQGYENTVEVRWAISFKEAFTGTKNTYLKCKDVHGARGEGEKVGTWTVTDAPTPTLIIGHITDAHIGAEWVYSQRLAATLSTINQQAQVMVDTGDCTENGTADETIEYVNLVTSNLSIPWRVAPGNHDTPEVFETYIGPLEWSWDIAGYRLIGINTESINYTALDQALTSEKPCVLLGHFPLSWCTPTDQIQLRQRFKTYDVPIYIAGHTHVDSFETDPESGTVLLTGQRAGLGHYRLITLRGLEVESVSFESVWQ